ncbi:restriction endonuclease [Streptomyces sp. NPDC048409]|uniref:restriction endonuclease n=1 Tax=Streptomyces sp. NPDC048409 TaxID=3154723 RepID=UPI003414348E
MNLRQELAALESLAGGMTAQTRGRKFEKWLTQLLSQDDLEPRTSFRPKGEEVDGSFLHRGRICLLEAKWWENAVPASAIYQFKGKVDGKLVGTLGMFISMSGYSSDAVDALRVGKDLNVVLFDKSDMEYAADVGFLEVLEFKLREAAEKGDVFVPYKAAVAPPPFVQRPLLTVVVEGARDAFIIQCIAQMLLERGDSVRELNMLAALGLAGLAPVAAAAARVNPGPIVVVADAFAGSTTIPNAEQLDGYEYEIIVIDPWIDRWLGLTSIDIPASQRLDVAQRVRQIDIDALAAEDKEFARLIKLLTS